MRWLSLMRAIQMRTVVISTPNEILLEPLMKGSNRRRTSSSTDSRIPEDYKNRTSEKKPDENEQYFWRIFELFFSACQQNAELDPSRTCGYGGGVTISSIVHDLMTQRNRPADKSGAMSGKGICVWMWWWRWNRDQVWQKHRCVKLDKQRITQLELNTFASLKTNIDAFNVLFIWSRMHLAFTREVTTNLCSHMMAWSNNMEVPLGLPQNCPCNTTTICQSPCSSSYEWSNDDTNRDTSVPSWSNYKIIQFTVTASIIMHQTFALISKPSTAIKCP